MSREGYFETYEISVLLDYLRILDNARQDLPLTAVLTSPFVGLDAEELAQIRLAYPNLPFYESVWLCGEEKTEETGADGSGETGEKEKKVLRDAYEKMDLTARACHKILKVARTIADMEQKEQIAEEHLYEAIGYRIFEQRQIWR